VLPYGKLRRRRSLTVVIVIDLPDATPAEASTDRPLTPAEALAKLFLANADRGANAENDELVAALRQRARDIQALAEVYPC
jgi:hypothetical protein